ncbi:hypothetical protein M0813_22441 [Anaeramoeba flamelloides]|uniref:Uncharacterized protein n=1 Tax=Anaeramoeba flamelloides TaxID=1746091 RepID=A0ABQ8YDB2_9EUKA|nr:hypothetical protein M0813_22441 [Anaeramoeba flamelloides]
MTTKNKDETKPKNETTQEKMDHLIYSCEKLLTLKKEKPVITIKLKNFLRDLNKKIEKPVKKTKKKQGASRFPRKVRQFKRPIRRGMPPYRNPYTRGYNGRAPIPVWHSPSKFARNDEYNRLREKFERERQTHRKVNLQKKKKQVGKNQSNKLTTPKKITATKKTKPVAKTRPKTTQGTKQRPNLPSRDSRAFNQEKKASIKKGNKDSEDQIIPLNQQEQEQKQLLFIYQTNEKETKKVQNELPNKKNESKDQKKKNNNNNKKGVSIPIKAKEEDSKNEELSLSVEEIKTTSFADFYFDSPSKSYGYTGQYDYVYPNSYVEDNESYLYNNMPTYATNEYYQDYDYGRSRPRSRSISNSRPQNLPKNMTLQKKNEKKVKENGKKEEKQKTMPIKKDEMKEPKQDLLSTSAPLKEPILDQYFESTNNNSENDNSENTKKKKGTQENKKSPNKLIKQGNNLPEEFFMEEGNSPKFVHSYDPRYDQYFSMQASSYDNQPNLFYFDQNNTNNKKNNKKNQKNGKNNRNNNNNSGILIPEENTFDPNIQNSPDQFAFEESSLNPYLVQDQFYQEEFYQQRNYNSSHHRKQYNDYYQNNPNNNEQFSTENYFKPNNTKNKKNDKLEVEEQMNLSRSVPDPIYDEYFQMKN